LGLTLDVIGFNVDDTEEEFVVSRIDVGGD
jgi:hypothetical protein